MSKVTSNTEEKGTRGRIRQIQIQREEQGRAGGFGVAKSRRSKRESKVLATEGQVASVGVRWCQRIQMRKTATTHADRGQVPFANKAEASMLPSKTGLAERCRWRMR